MNCVVAEDGTSITCGHCGLTSHHPDDVAARYCGNCKLFHDADTGLCEDCGQLLVKLVAHRNPAPLPRFCGLCRDKRP